MGEKNIIMIMGPSGAGKTTIGNMIVKTYDYGVPKHCTTREQRTDDEQDFYRYLNILNLGNMLMLVNIYYGVVILK